MEDREYELRAFSERLKRMRVEGGYDTAAAMAEAIGMKTGTYGSIEQGRNFPQLMAAGDIADALGCSVDELIGRETPVGDVSAPAPVLKAISQANDSGIKLLADVSKVILNTPELLK